MATKTRKPGKCLVLPDMQIPFEAPGAVEAVLDYAKDDGGWTHVVSLGDFMDLDHMSKYVEGYPGDTQGRLLKEDYEWGNYYLDRIEYAVGPRAEKAFIKGNHDIRVDRFVARHPHLKGLLEVEHCLRLDKRGWNVVRSYPNGDIYRIGKLGFHHGQYVTDGHAKKHALSYGKNIMYGHVHDIQSYSLKQFGRGHTIEAVSIGCLCDLEQGYVGKAPTNWSLAFAVVYFRPNGDYNAYVVRIINGAFTAPNGKTYKI